MTNLTYYFDPLCPWSWRTSVWIREVQRQQELQISWKFFSLAKINNLSDEATGGPLRVIALARRQAEGDANELVSKLYKTIGTAIHETGKPTRGVEGAIEAATRSGLAEAGLDPNLWQQALGDPSTWEEVLVEHQEGVEKYKAFGVPWLVLDDTEFGFYGPVIKEPPLDQAALDLWQHVAWLFTQPYLYEIKRDR